MGNLQDGQDYDAFTYNLVQCLSELGLEVRVHQNDEINRDEIEQRAPVHTAILPCPCPRATGDV